MHEPLNLICFLNRYDFFPGTVFNILFFTRSAFQIRVAVVIGFYKSPSLTGDYDFN